MVRYYRHLVPAAGVSGRVWGEGALLREHPSENKFMMHAYYSLYFMFNCTAIPIILHVIPATPMGFFVSRHDFFYSLLLSVRVLCYQPSCHNCFQHVAVFKFVVARSLLQLLKQTIIA
jgi:hypothetical protein